MTGDGGAALPDGTWSIPLPPPVFLSSTPPTLDLDVTCMEITGKVLFAYPRLTFTFTG